MSRVLMFTLLFSSLIMGCSSSILKRTEGTSLQTRNVAAVDESSRCLSEGSNSIKLDRGEAIIPPPSSKALVYDGDIENHIVRYYYAISYNGARPLGGYVVEMNSDNCSLLNQPVYGLPID